MNEPATVGINGTYKRRDEEPSGASAQSRSDQDAKTNDGYGESPRQPRAERERAFDMGGWLLQGLTGLSEELRHSDLGLPEEFWVHAYAARKEALLAARALVDAALERCAAEEKRNAAGKTASTKKPPQRGQVSIDFG
ncbi:MAG: hypothetical protein KJZ86_25055 [Caldilineaceae bacterium]|nr:hypothetical protein [Caldilineaceae bacterium]HRJ43300.1 hypothetical protein [Caldilineaceae bacterium]